MTLKDVKEKNGWLFSEWQLAYLTGWNGICRAARLLRQNLINPEILVDDDPVSVSSEDEIMSLEEAGSLTIRGMSEHLGVPVMLAFFNQTAIVRATVAGATEEFAQADYKRFNQSMGQYMDSIEIAMHTAR